MKETDRMDGMKETDTIKETDKMEGTAYVPLVRLAMIKERELPYRTAGKNVDNPEKVMELAGQILKGADREYFLVLSMNTRNVPQALETVAVGSVNAAGVVPREAFKHAVLANAATVILVHNHPSGNCTPSREDRMMTKRMEEAGQLLGIPVEDHVIIGDGYFSFREQGLLKYSGKNPGCTEALPASESDAPVWKGGDGLSSGRS